MRPAGHGLGREGEMRVALGAAGEEGGAGVLLDSAARCSSDVGANERTNSLFKPHLSLSRGAAACFTDSKDCIK